MKRYMQAAILAAVLMGSAVTALAGDVQTDYNHNANFSQYKTYSWGQVKTTDPFYVNRVQQAVNKQLQDKGWKLVPTGGSVTVFASDNIHSQQEIQTWYDGMGSGWGGGWGWGGWAWGTGWSPMFGGTGMATTRTVDQNVGNLVVDIFEGNSKQILWRGLATENLSSNDDKNTRQLDQDIAKMFKGFPPKPGR